MAADAVRPARIKKVAVAVSARKHDVLPRVVVLAIRLIHAVVQLAFDTEFPSQPLHYPVGGSRNIDHVAGPPGKVVSSHDVAAMACAGLIEPKTLAGRLPGIRIKW